MIEEAEHPFPPPDEVNHENEEEPIENHDPDVADLPAEMEEENAEQSRADEDRKETEMNGDDMDEKSVADDQPTDSAPFPVSSSSEGETTGPSTAENSQSHAPPPIDDIIINEPKQVVGGRASIPDELEPHQLARLQDLKESNA